MYISCIRFSWDMSRAEKHSLECRPPGHEFACDALVPPSGIWSVGSLVRCLVDVVNFFMQKKDLM